MITGLLIDGVAAETLGLRVATLDGWRGAPARTWTTAVVPGRGGATRTGDAPQEPIREIKIAGLVRGATTTAARNALDVVRTALGKRAGVVLTAGDDLTRTATGVLTGWSVTPYGPFVLATDFDVVATIALIDPYAYDVTPTSLSAGSVTPRVMPMGTGPVRPLVTITGTASAPVLTLKDSGGAVVQTMSFSGSLATFSSKYVVDCDVCTVVNESGATKLSELAGGDFFVVDPEVVGASPTLEVSVGSLAIAYRRAWR